MHRVHRDLSRPGRVRPLVEAERAYYGTSSPAPQSMAGHQRYDERPYEPRRYDERSYADRREDDRKHKKRRRSRISLVAPSTLTS